MYERFTDRARKVMQMANQEAQRFNHEYIGTEHILIALVEEGAGLAANVLKNLGIDLRKIRLEVEQIAQFGRDEATMGKLPQTPKAKKVVEYSIEEARNLNHNYVGTEHLLLGLLREQEGVAAQVLMNLGLKLEDVREEILYLLGFDVNTQEAPTRRADVSLAQDLNRALMFLPEEFVQVLTEINSRIEKLTQEKEEALAERDFEKAGRLSDQADKFKRKLLDGIRDLRTLVRESENDPS
jgi:ATP-dependent Clp protease ATP-binding subunit ClpA